MIVLRFVTCNDLVSRVIRGGELGFWASHVEAVTPDNCYLGAHADGGVQKRPHDYDVGHWTKQVFVSIPVSMAQETAFWAFLYSQIGAPYDMAAIGDLAEGVITPLFGAEKQQKWICSSLQVQALITAGVIKSAAATVRLTTPRDLLCALGVLTVVAPIGT
jgi:hypothetical protein